MLEELNIPPHSTLIISVSGGVDSMVLLDLLTTLNYRLVVVHFNHQKRIDSLNDKELIAKYCFLKNITFEYIKLQISSADFQKEARIQRIKHLKIIAGKYFSNYILTAHHLDDLLETVLMKISRGSNLYGYAGMQLVTIVDSFRFIKPLLYYSKENILSYAKEHHIPYYDDSTNNADDYTRNRFRHYIIPELKKENPHILEKTISYHIQITNAFNYIRNKTKTYFKENGIYLVSEFKSLDPAIQNDLLSLILEQQNIEPNFRLIMKIKELIENQKPNIQYNLKNNRYFVKSYDLFYLDEEKPLVNVHIKAAINQTITIGTRSFTFFNKNSDLLQDAIQICYNELMFPLIFRNRLAGDVLEFTFGHKKLKDFLIDQKIPKVKRDTLIIISDSNNRIIFIPELYINKTLGNKHEMYLLMED